MNSLWSILFFTFTQTIKSIWFSEMHLLHRPQKASRDFGPCLKSAAVV